MTSRARERLPFAAILLAGAVVFGVGIRWGLPSRDVDGFLFGDREPWSGETISTLAGARPETTTRGADVDATPLMRSDDSVIVNETDKQRAQILIRYRLYTSQPDEMITFMSLAEMRPRSFGLDPKLYQYGGCWIYSVGALLKAASVLGLVHLDRDLTHYLDHPEHFGRFYVIARIYSAGWGLVGACAVYRLARRLMRRTTPETASSTGRSTTIVAASGQESQTRHFGAALAASAAYLALPVVINMAHEAKPHLAAAVLMLLAVIAAAGYVETGRAREWIAAGILCGLSFGTVLSALPIFIVLPIMVVLRPDHWNRRALVLLGSGLLGALTYAVTNPYIIINWFTNRAVLESNLRNSLSMYAVGGWADGIHKTGYLLGEATTPVIAVLGVIASAALLALKSDRIRAGLSRSPRDARVVTALLLGAPAAVVLLQFCSLAAGKPSEYGRFLVYPATVLTLAAIACVQYVHPPGARRWQFIVVAAAIVFGSRYVYAFYRDITNGNSRRLAAEYLAERPEKTILVPAEPAPYNLPPVNLFTRKIIVEPILTAPAAGQLLVFPADHPDQVDLPPESDRLWPTRRTRPLGEAAISWADKAILIVTPK